VDTTLEHSKAKGLRQHEIRVAEIKRRAQTWRLMDCDEDTLRQMRDALTEEMRALESRLAEADDHFMVYVEKGLPLETEQTRQLIERLSTEWENLNKHLKDVNNALLERRLRTRLAEWLGGERRVTYLDGAVFVLIVIALGLRMIELLFPLPYRTLAWFITVDFIICTFLVSDFSLRLSLAEEKGWYFRRYWIDLVSSIPYYGILRIGRLFRINRFLRLFRLLRLSRALRVLLFAFRGLDKLTKTFEMNLLKRSMLIAVVLLIFGALSISALEGVEEKSLQEMGESLWWSFTTVVTGGFADLHNPNTLTGRVVTAGLVLLGFAVTGIFTASLTSVLVEDDSSRIEQTQRGLQAQLAGVHEKLDLLSGATNEGLIAMATAAQLLSNQTSREGVASVMAETMVQDFECLQASVHLLDSDKQELLRITHLGLAEVTPPEREKLGANLTGRTVTKLLQGPKLADIDLEPETELCVTIKGVALACPLVANLQVLGVLHIVLPENLARFYVYNRLPMTLSHHAATAIHAADLADQVGL
jgi:voltage-gated potassium channel